MNFDVQGNSRDQFVMYYSKIYAEGLRKTTKHLGLIFFLVWKSKRVTYEQEARALITQPRRSAELKKTMKTAGWRSGKSTAPLVQ
jgi:hypothetical protein